MVVVQINAVSGVGSTGKIAEDMSRLLNSQNIKNYILYSVGKTNYENSIKYMSEFDVKINAAKAKIFGNYGLNSTTATKRLINKIEKINPDVIHIHNIHGHNVNFYTFFKYLQDKQKKVIWTFHDCWAFTAYCPHFESLNCKKWKNECEECDYAIKSRFLRDRSKKIFQLKREIFTGLKDFKIIVPSQWLGNIVKESFFSSKYIKVINNGINIERFKPTVSNLKLDYGIENKKVVLGICIENNKLKGFDHFIKIAKMLSEEYIMILIGAKKVKGLPNNIIVVEKTNNIKKLAQLYSIADVFINPTLEDNFPTVNLESLACGTPVIAFNVGGACEAIDESTGRKIEKGNTKEMYNAIIDVVNGENLTNNCIKKAKEKYNKELKYMEYLEEYRDEKI